MTIRAFSIVELIIVVAILGILAAIVLPDFQNTSTEAREAAARTNLHTLRAAVELYATQHGGTAPGYLNGDTSTNPNWAVFFAQLLKATTADSQIAEVGTPGYPLGPYLSAIPENPFNNSKTVQMLGNSQSFPVEATGTFGWIYKPATKQIRLDWPGTDEKGTRYYDY